MIFESGDKIMFTGDSTTDSGRKRPVGDGLWEGVGNGYVRAVDSMLSVLYPERKLHIVNMGVSGATSEDLVGFWDKDILPQKPDWLFLMIGINDVWRQFDEPVHDWTSKSPEAYRKNVARLISDTLKSGVKGMFVMSPFYMEKNDGDEMKKRTLEYAAIAREEAEKAGVTYIDLQPDFDEHVKYRYPAYISWDRVHPNWVGSMIIARKIMSVIGAKTLY